MTWYMKMSVIVYSVLMIQCAITATIIYIKAKKTDERSSLIVCQAAIMLWLFFSMTEYMSTNAAEMLFTVRLTLLPIMFISSLWLIFSLFYAELLTPKNKKKIILLILLPPILCAWPLVTTKYFYLLIVSKAFGFNGVTKWGTLFMVSLVISYLNIMASAVIIFKKSAKGKGPGKKGWPLMLAILFPIIVSFLTGTKILESPGFNLTPLSFFFFNIMMTIYILKYNFIEIVPMAAYELFSTLNEAVMIVNQRGNIMEYNDACSEYFITAFGSGRCRDIGSFFSLLSEHTDDVVTLEKMQRAASNAEDAIYEDTIRINAIVPAMKQYSFCIMPIKKSGGKPIGKILKIKDVTEYRSSTLKTERDRLSYDLHDGLGNCINVISSNLEYAMNNFDNTPEIKACIEKSYDKTTTAFLHLRRIVNELKPIDIENNGFIWALESLFEKLRMKNVKIEFNHQNIDDKQMSGHMHGETIYFICQEAITNSLIHGKAKEIIVTLIQKSNELYLYIADDGNGCEKIVKSTGLTSMERRVAALNGEIEYGSPSDGGFNLRVVIPIDCLLREDTEVSI